MNRIERQKEIVAQLKPMDDILAAKILEDVNVCQEIIATILDDPELEIIEVCPQKSIRNLQGRSVQLDALCKRSDGTVFNVELQKSDDDDHIKRVRYNAACITANVAEPGIKFEHIPDVYIIFISRFDMFRAGKTTYHMDYVIRENGVYVDNGQYTIFVNTKVDDGSNIAELMKCLEQTQVENPKFPHLSERMRQLKGSEEGGEGMNRLLEDYAAECKKESSLETARKLFGMGISLEQIRNAIDEKLVSTEELLELQTEVRTAD